MLTPRPSTSQSTVSAPDHERSGNLDFPKVELFPEKISSTRQRVAFIYKWKSSEGEACVCVGVGEGLGLGLGGAESAEVRCAVLNSHVAVCW